MLKLICLILAPYLAISQNIGPNLNILGWKFVNIYTSEIQPNPIFKELSTYGIRAKLSRKFQNGKNLILTENGTFLESILLKSKSEENFFINRNFDLKSLENFNFTTSFFTLDPNENLTRIFTFKNQKKIVKNPINQNLDLEGSIIKSISLDWWPWIKFESCNQNQEKCQISGMLLCPAQFVLCFYCLALFG